MKKSYEKWDMHLIDCQLEGKQNLTTLSLELLKDELNNAGFINAKTMYCINPQCSPISNGESENGITSLDDSSMYLLKLLTEKQTSLDLIVELANKYELTYEQSSSDVKNFLQIALNKQIILEC
ncbi:MAG: PqqD family protein [Erysipelotrichaceae bacterium]|nr:PqqD family protein [Erysipelotrichaceae bacterium]